MCKIIFDGIIKQKPKSMVIRFLCIFNVYLQIQHIYIYGQIVSLAALINYTIYTIKHFIDH